MVTREHHHMLEVVAYLVGASQVEEEGEGVDVEGAAYDDSELSQTVREMVSSQWRINTLNYLAKGAYHTDVCIKT